MATNEQEFSLDDIMKEFSGELDENERALLEQDGVQMPLLEHKPQTPAPEQDTQVLPQLELLQKPAPQQPSLGDTQVLPDLGDTRVIPDLGDTQVLPDVEQTKVLPDVEQPAPEDTQVIPTLEDTAVLPEPEALIRAAEEAKARQEQQEEAEPFSEQWQPEFEQPIAEYVPPQPIVFHPRSRLQELKRKLVAGPEQEYYRITETGVGRLQACIFLSLLVVLISAVTTAMYAFGLVQEHRLRLMVFGQFLAMLVAALLGSFQMIEGMADLFKGRFTLNTLLVFTFAACCADGVLCLQQLKVPCCAAFSLEVTMSLWATYQRRVTRIGQLDTMRKATRLDSVTAVEDFYQGQKGFVRGEGQVEDFMDSYTDTSKPEKVLQVYALVALLLSIGIGVAAGVLHNVTLGIRVTAVCLLAAMPASAFITASRPMAVLEKRLHSLGTVLCGWAGVKGLSGKALFSVGHEDLFPSGTVKLNGVKFYGSRDPDEVVAYATALVAADAGELTPAFVSLLDSRSAKHYTVEKLRTYDNGGIGGEIGGISVLVGVHSFLKDMGVEIPEGTRVAQAVYAAVDGELCGVFAITCDKVRSASAGISVLCAYRGLKPVLTTGDFMLTESYIRSKFGVNPKKVLFPPMEERDELQLKQPQEGAKALLLTTQEGLASAAYGVAGARVVSTAVKLGVVIHMIGGIVGLLAMLALAVLGAEQLLTPANMFLYELVWMVPGLLITEWTRSI